jgi:hypothetical protein
VLGEFVAMSETDHEHECEVGAPHGSFAFKCGRSGRRVTPRLRAITGPSLLTKS